MKKGSSPPTGFVNWLMAFVSKDQPQSLMVLGWYLLLKQVAKQNIISSGN